MSLSSINNTSADIGTQKCFGDAKITSINEVCNILEGAQEVNKEIVEDVLSRYVGTDYQRYVKTGTEGRYHRGEVCTGTNDKFCILVMTWNPSNGSAIHSHGDSECSLKLLEGEHLEERIYRTNGPSDLKVNDAQGMSMDTHIDVSKRTTGASECGTIGYVNDKIGPHAIWNMDSEAHAVSLHVYYPAYDKCWVFDDSSGSGKICLVKACAEKKPSATAPEDVDEVSDETRPGSPGTGSEEHSPGACNKSADLSSVSE